MLSAGKGLDYVLPEDAQIQAAAQIGKRTLVVWGTTARRGDSIVNELRGEAIEAGVSIGGQQRVHSLDARPGWMVQVIPLKDRFLVVWLDHRGTDTAVYLQRIATDGSLSGSEEVLWPGPITGLNISVTGSPRGYRLLWTPRDPSQTSLIQEIDSSGDFLDSTPHPIDGRVVEVREPDSTTGAILVLRSGRIPAILLPGGALEELDSMIASRFSLLYYLDDDGSLAVMSNDTLRLYRSVFDAMPLRAIHIGMSYGHSGALMLTRLVTGEFAILYCSGGTGYYPAPAWNNYSYIYAELYRAVLSAGDTLLRSTHLGVVPVEGLDWHTSVDIRYTGARSARGCRNNYQLVLGFQKDRHLTYDGVTTTRTVNDSETVNINSDGEIYWPDQYGNGRGRPTLPDGFPAGRSVSVRRIVNYRSSEVEVKTSAASVRLMAPIGNRELDVSCSLPGIVMRQGRKLVTWRARHDHVEYELGEWSPDSTGTVRMLGEIDERMIVDSTGPTVIDQTDLIRDSIVAFGGTAFLHSAHRWTEKLTVGGFPESGQLASRHQFAVFEPSIGGWVRSLVLSPGNMGFWEFGWRNYASDPVTGSILGAVVSPLLVDTNSNIHPPKTYVFSIDSAGTLAWRTDSVINTFGAFDVIPVGEREFFAIIGDSVFHMSGVDTAAKFTLPANHPAGCLYSRLPGSRFMRRYFVPNSRTLALQVFNLNGDLVRADSLVFDAPPFDLSLVSSPADSSLVLLWGGSGGVRMTRLDTLLKAHERGVLVSTTTDSVRHPSGAFLRDSLYIVWEDYRNQRPAIYGAVVGLPRIIAVPAGAREDLPSARFAATLIPNPAHGTATVKFALSGSETVYLQIVDESGRTLATRSLGLLRAGEHTLPLDIQEMGSGAYTVIVRTGTATTALRLIICR
jgi:hypothetical protein